MILAEWIWRESSAIIKLRRIIDVLLVPLFDLDQKSRIVNLLNKEITSMMGNVRMYSLRLYNT
jgi:hypothetical protein